jgi:hypothetical protein
VIRVYPRESAAQLFLTCSFVSDFEDWHTQCCATGFH